MDGQQRFSTYGSGGSLFDQLIAMTSSARRRVWIKVPWWDVSEKARELLDAVTDSARRGIDVLVLSRPEASNDAAHRELRQAGVRVVVVRYIHEKELVADDVALTHSMNFTRAEIGRNENSGNLIADRVVVDAVVAGFESLLVNRAAVTVGEEEWTPTDRLIPERMRPFMTRYSRLNPLQSKAVPAVLHLSGHVMVVAPTSAGKTLIGEVAVLRSIIEEERPAVWLLPARALAAEIGEATRRWRAHGVSAVELTGETNIASETIQKAQLWVATTEKFEALYRRSSLREFISKVGCIVIDEVHLVGDPQRGATLEALIARLRAVSERTRIVALSATVSNAAELSSWFNAELIEVAWRPTILTTQYVPYVVQPPGRFGDVQEAKDGAIRSVLESVRPAPCEDSACVDGDRGEASVLVFCGTKNNVLRTAALAAGIDFGPASDVEPLVGECFRRGVGMHFRDAPHASRALSAFKERSINTLVATSGLSTGVNTPARIVVIRDLTLGKDTPLEVSQAQQMLGRAGRAGQEPEGFGYLLVPDDEELDWRRKLADGYVARSNVAAQLTDVILAEVLLGSIADRESAAAWFEETFAFAQSGDAAQVDGAVDFLVAKGFVVEDGGALATTELGALTSRLMVEAESAAEILSKLAAAPLPSSAAEAEEIVLAVVSSATTKLREWPINQRTYQPVVEEILDRWSRRALSLTGEDFGPQFCMAAATLALRDQRRLRAKPPQGISLAEFRRAIDEMPRYLAWVSALGYLGASNWAPAVAGDLSRRLTWWGLQPVAERGHGRLLWLLEKSVNPENRRTGMQDLWRRARDAGFDGPDTIRARPRGVDISTDQFTQIIESRATLELDPADGLSVPIRNSTTESRLAVLSNTGRRRAAVTFEQTRAATIPVPHNSPPGPVAADLFLYTRSGDYAYANLMTEIPEGGEPAKDAIEESREAIARLHGVATVTKSIGRVRKLMMSERAQRAAQIGPLIAPDPQLQPVARALAEHDDEPTAAIISMRANVAKLLRLRLTGEVRPAVTVLRSGEATPDERELVLCALLGTLGHEVGVATYNGSLVALVHLGDNWKMVTLTIEGRANVVPLIPSGLPSILHTVVPLTRNPDEPAIPKCTWMADFVL
ncbi:DEAD/DEAH box helicase [Tsukamurella pulmonis]|uniref:DEAD/DEAH box helicase n=1 Tax=Tsukamurella pulmonis TaxID=47312 RepID=UPI000E098292|nr:DEAD/DEAH box helicase [Tsukamurella pulmonis]RDH13412.1 DEAD/DEAH box helicase [Tsukamurella pulmonis]